MKKLGIKILMKKLMKNSYEKLMKKTLLKNSYGKNSCEIKLMKKLL